MLNVWRLRDGDRLHGGGAFQFERLFVRVTRWRVVLIGAGVAAYAAGLVAFLPAEVVTGADRDAVGTVWKGETAVAPAFALGWTADPLASVASLSASGDVRLRGPGTALPARVSVGRRRMIVRQADGTVNLAALGGLFPALPIRCEGSATVRIDGFSLFGGRTGSGAVASEAASCGGGGQTLPAGPLRIALSSDAGGSTTVASGAAGVEMARLRVGRDGRASATVAANAALPGLPAGTIETTL